MKNIIKLCIVLCFQSTYCQNFDNRLYSCDINKMLYYKYENAKIFATISDISQIKNNYPEQLMQSLISCTNKEWEIVNTLDGEENIDIRTPEEYDQIKKMDKIKNYFELVNKIEFKIDSIFTAVIKFNFISISYPKPQAGIIVMQKINDRWYKTNTKMVNHIALSMLRLKPQLFNKLILNIFDTMELKNLKQKIHSGSKLDFNKLSLEIDSWYIDNPKLKEYFKDPYSIL